MLCGRFKSAVKAPSLRLLCYFSAISIQVRKRQRAIMIRFPYMVVFSLLGCCAALMGCGTGTPYGALGTGNGNSSVVLAITDTPPSNVSILSAEVTLTGATLAPGNVSLFSGTTTVELTRLQTDIAYLATAAKVPAGTYTGVALTFANPMVTFENDTPSAIGSCAVGSICTIAPVASNLSTTVPLAFTIASASATGLLIDVNLDNLLSATMGADFSAGTTVTSFLPAGIGAPPVGAEDVVGQVGSINSASNTFTLTNATGTYSLKADSSSTFFQFPSTGTCTSEVFACLQNNQIVSVDIGIQSDGSILARNVLFEDSSNTEAEIEGIITSTNLASNQFNLVIQTMSTKVTGLSIGQSITVQFSISPQTPFDLDLIHADNATLSTAPFHFAAATDLAPSGQQVSILRNSSSTSSLLKADRVRLRSSRISATVQSIGSPNIYLFMLPTLFTGHGGVNEIQAQTTSALIVDNNKLIPLTQVPVSGVVSVRGPLFNAGATQNLVATKVVVKP